MKFIIPLLLILLAGTPAVFAQPAAPKTDAPESDKTVYDFTMEDIDGKPVPLSQYKGKVLLIVNVASKCGYTPQYKPLEELYQKFKDRGFEVLAFPANNFKEQEPGTNAEIKNFCFVTYGTTFPLFAKSNVTGPDISPLYKYLTEENPYKGPISWNFNKFLVNAKGEVIARFAPGVDPMAPVLVNGIERTLGPAQAKDPAAAFK